MRHLCNPAGGQETVKKMLTALCAKPVRGAVSGAAKVQLHAIVLRRELSRETLREAALLCITFFCAERMRMGCAAASAALAASLSPEAIASSTLRT